MSGLCLAVLMPPRLRRLNMGGKKEAAISSFALVLPTKPQQMTLAETHYLQGRFPVAGVRKMYTSKALAKTPHSSQYVGQLLKCCPVCPALTCVTSSQPSVCVSKGTCSYIKPEYNKVLTQGLIQSPCAVLWKRQMLTVLFCVHCRC